MTLARMWGLALYIHSGAPGRVCGYYPTLLPLVAPNQPGRQGRHHVTADPPVLLFKVPAGHWRQG